MFNAGGGDGRIVEWALFRLVKLVITGADCGPDASQVSFRVPAHKIHVPVSGSLF